MASQWWSFWKRGQSIRKSSRKPFRTTPRFDTLEDRAVPANLSITQVQSVLEGDAGTRDMVFTLTLDAPEADPISVLVSPVEIAGGASLGVDFEGGGEFVNWGPNDAAPKQFIVKIKGDTDVEPNETFRIEFGLTVGQVTLPPNPAATGTIEDDDVAPPPPPPPPPPPLPQGQPPAVVRANSTFAGAIEVAAPDARLETTPVEQWKTVATATSKAEPAFYKVTMGLPFALAVDLNKGANDPGVVLELFDANQNRLQVTVDLANNHVVDPFGYGSGEGAPENAGLYADLQAGTYYVKAAPIFGSADITLSFLTDTVYSATVPIFESLPGAPVSLLIDFDGHASNSPADYWVGLGFTPSYSFSAINIRGTGHAGNAGTFSPAERLYMANTWKQVAEDYSPFNINVTTKEVPLVQNGVPLGQRAVVINKDEQQKWQSGGSGNGPLNGMSSMFPGMAPSFSYATTNVPTTGFLTKNLSILKGFDAVSHESGHTFGLEHQLGIKTNVPNTVPGQPALGIGLDGVMSGGSKFKADDKATTWVVGTNTPSVPPGNAPTLQVDMDVIARPANRAGYRPDEAGGTTAAATPLDAVGSTYTRTGVIGKSDDVDIYSFTASGKTTINVGVGSWASDPGLITMIELLNSTGGVVAQGVKGVGSRHAQDIHGTLTARTGDDAGQVTIAFTVGIAVGGKINISWGAGDKVVSRSDMEVVAINGNVVTVKGGDGRDLPAVNSQIIAVTYLPEGGSSITADNLAAGTYFLKITGIGRRVTDTPGTLIEIVGQYSIKINTAAAPAGQPANQAPVVTLPTAGNVAYKSQTDAVLIDGAAKVTDDDPNFNGGKLTITLAGGTNDDTLGIQLSGDIHAGFGGINFKKDPIGTTTGGTAGEPLVLNFTDDKATAEVVQAFLRSITFSSQAPITALGGNRTINVTLTDRRGATSTLASKTITVTAPDRQAIKLVDNKGLTVPIDAPKAFGNADLKSTAPDSPIGALTIFYTITQTPKNGDLLLMLPSDVPQSPNFLPVVMHVGDEVTQNQIDNGYFAYRLTPGSLANDDQFSFTATDLTTGVIPETIVKIRVTRGAAPQAGAPGAPIAAEEGTVVPPEASGDPNMFLTITNVAIQTVIPANRLSFQTEDGDPRNVQYELVDAPQFGTLNLTTFTQQMINDNALIYTTPLVSGVDADRDWFTFVVRDLTTGGVTDSITFVIGLDNPNDAPFFIAGTNDVDIAPVLPFGPHESISAVQDILIGVFNDPDYVPGQQHGFGLAITGVDNSHGQWSYSTDDGATWTDIDAASISNAVVLSGYLDTTLVRFEASDLDFVGNAQFQFHLWDEVNEAANGSFVDLSEDELNAYSLATGTANVSIAAAGRSPSFTAGEDVVVNEDAGVVVVTGWATDIVGDNVSAVTFEVSLAESPGSEGPAIEFLQAPTISADGTLSFEVAANQSGTAIFEVIIPSAFGDSQELIITVNAVNDAPTITVGPGFTTSAAAGSVISPGWATGITAGGESEQTLTVELVTDNPGLFEIAPAVDLVTGNLTYKPKVDGAGTANVFLTLTDSGGASTLRGFTLTVTPALPVSAQTIQLIKNVYQDLLGRQPESNGLLGWANVLSVGFTPTQFIDAVTHSVEYQILQVTNLFQSLLRRAPDPAGLNSFVSALQQGATIRQVESIVISSPEYFAVRGGDTNAGFVAALYQDILGRQPDPSATSFTVLLDAGSSRSAVADAVLNSAEAAAVYVQSAYQKYLGRAADPVGLAALTGMYQTTGENDVIKMLLGSAEYAAQP